MDLGTCRNCLQRRLVSHASRKGGGDYRRAQRWYSSSICGECATELASRISEHSSTTSNWSNNDLRRVAALHSLNKILETSTDA